jgi:hypothetical protein
MPQMHEPSHDPALANRAPTQIQAPAAVTALAAERQLGQLCNARIVLDPARIGRMAAIIGVPSAVLVAVGLTRTGFLGILGLLGLVGVVVALVTLAYAVKTWLAGADDWYLYTGGVVARRQRRFWAFSWSEVSALARRRMGNLASSRGSLVTPTTLRGYQVSLKDGAGQFLTASDVLDEGKRLGIELEQLAAQANTPVSG